MKNPDSKLHWTAQCPEGAFGALGFKEGNLNG